MTDQSPPSSYMREYLDISSTVTDEGVRYRILDLRSRVQSSLGEQTEAIASLSDAHESADRLASQMPADFQNAFREHPWISELRRRFV